MTLSSRAKTVLVSIYTPMFLIGYGLIIFDSVAYREQAGCYTCPFNEGPDELPPIWTRYVMFSYWSFWLTTGVFVIWIGSWKIGSWKTIAKRINYVALPHASAVMIGAVYYEANKPPRTDFLNFEDCWAWENYGSIALSKQIVDDRTVRWIDVYLVCGVISDLIYHYLSVPLLLILVFSGELDFDSWIPFSLFFEIVLGILVALVDYYKINLYCGESGWFVSLCLAALNLLTFMLYVMWYRRIPSFLCRYCYLGPRQEEQQNEGESKDVGTGKTAKRLDDVEDIEDVEDVVEDVDKTFPNEQSEDMDCVSWKSDTKWHEEA